MRHQANKNERRRDNLVLKWEGIFEDFTSKKDSLTNEKGMAWMHVENKMILLALRGAVDAHLNMVKLRVWDSINWTAVESKLASACGVKQERVNKLRQQFLETGEVVVWERRVAELEEEAAHGAPVNCGSKLLPHHMLSACAWVDEQRSEGGSVTTFKAWNCICVTFEIEVTQRLVRWCFARLGLSWKKIKMKKRTLDGCRIDTVPEFLIKPDKCVKKMSEDGDNMLCRHAPTNPTITTTTCQE
jgi:hypothetical protein